MVLFNAVDELLACHVVVGFHVACCGGVTYVFIYVCMYVRM